jgi:hypothetical protein
LALLIAGFLTMEIDEYLPYEGGLVLGKPTAGKEFGEGLG